MTHHSKMNFEAWCHHVETCANTMTDGIFNFRNIELNWAERYQDGEPLATTIDALVVAAWDASKKLFARPEFRSAA